MDYPVTENEPQRLEAVRSYEAFRSPPEPAFDDLAELAAQLAHAPIAFVNIMEESNGWLKAKHGLPPELTEVPRGAVCCAHAICRSDILVVPDLTTDERFRNLPFIGSEPFLKFYAGMPLINAQGYALGTLCVMDFQPRQIDFDQVEGIRRLSRQVVAQLELRRKLREVEDAKQRLAEQTKRSEALILNILPTVIAAELHSSGHVEPKHHPSVTILFADFVGFSRLAENMAPRALLDELDSFFSAFDDITARHGLEKLKTIGDAYMCVAGLPKQNARHAVDVCLAALAMQTHMVGANAQRIKLHLPPWQIRIGIHTGSVMAGVVGKNKFTYDIWGDAVNVAARMESAGEGGRINVSDTTYHHVKNYFDTAARGTISVKNRGEIPMYFLDRLKPEFSRDADGLTPNEALDQALSGSSRSWAIPKA
jgi:class 3 adenylate cyclase